MIIQNPIQATLGERVGAHIITVLYIAVLVSAAIFIPFASGFRGENGGLGYAVIVLVFVFLYFFVTFSLIIKRAQSFGMYMLNLQVVDSVTGEPLSAVRHIFLRGIVGQVILRLVPLYAMADFLFALNRDQKTLHDHIAGSIVLRIDDSIKQKFNPSGSIASARNVKYDLADLQATKSSRMVPWIIGIVIAFFVILPIMAAITLVAINPARRLAEQKSEMANSMHLDVARIDGLVATIDREKKDYQTKVLEDRKTAIQNDDGPAELIGYYKKGEIQKINLLMDLSDGVFLNEYYFDDNELMFARASELIFPKGQESKRDYDSLELVFESRRYFDANVMIQKKSEGTRTLTSARKEDEEQLSLDMAKGLKDALAQ